MACLRAATVSRSVRRWRDEAKPSSTACLLAVGRDWEHELWTSRKGTAFRSVPTLFGPMPDPGMIEMRFPAAPWIRRKPARPAGAVMAPPDVRMRSKPNKIEGAVERAAEALGAIEKMAQQGCIQSAVRA